MFKSKLIWQGDPEGEYAAHRIPGMIVTNRGTLIIYNEARRQNHDWAMIDIFLQRSEDHGESFGERIYLARGTEEHKTVNNPVMMQDKNGRIHFLYCEDYATKGGRVLRRYSDDDGLTWSEEIDVTASTMPHFRNAFALGPGHGICTRDGMLLVPVWMVPKYYEAHIRDHAPSVISTFYSKDNGETWQCGDILPVTSDVINPGETVAAELSDGRIYLSIRCATKYRAMAISRTGYSEWTNYVPDKRLSDPACFGSVVSYNHSDNPCTLVFVNCESKLDRKNVVVKGSTDNSINWQYRRVIDPDRGGYADIAADNEAGFIYVLYEDNLGETDTLAIFDYEWLSEKE